MKRWDQTKTEPPSGTREMCHYIADAIRITLPDGTGLRQQDLAIRLKLVKSHVGVDFAKAGLVSIDPICNDGNEQYRKQTN